MAASRECVPTAGEDPEKECPPGCGDAGAAHTDRSYVRDFLKISEEASLKEQEPYEEFIFSGWDEAVRGWGRVHPLGCLLVPLKKVKKPKNSGPKYHCLFCAELNLLETQSPSKHSGDCHANSHDGGQITAAPPPSLQAKAQNNKALSPPAQQSSTPRLLLREQMDNLRLRLSFQRSQPAHVSNLSVPILPPVKSPQCKSLRVGGQICGNEAALEGRGEEAKDNTLRFADPPKDVNRAMLASNCSSCQQSHRLLNTFRVPASKVPLSSIAALVPGSTFSKANNLRKAERTGSGFRSRSQWASSQHFMVLATKVPLTVPRQRKR